MGLFDIFNSNNKNKKSDKKKFSDVEIENSYFGNGILVKDSSTEPPCYKDIKSGFDGIDFFGKNSDLPYDLHEFIVREDNIDYVLTSLEKIYKESDQIMEGCYDEIYNEIIKFFEDGRCLKNEFNLDYLKENWYVSGIAIYDDHVEFSIGINAAENHEEDSYYEIMISVEYDTQEAEVTFNIVW